MTEEEFDKMLIEEIGVDENRLSQAHMILSNRFRAVPRFRSGELVRTGSITMYGVVHDYLIDSKGNVTLIGYDGEPLVKLMGGCPVGEIDTTFLKDVTDSRVSVEDDVWDVEHPEKGRGVIVDVRSNEFKNCTVQWVARQQVEKINSRHLSKSFDGIRYEF